MKQTIIITLIALFPLLSSAQKEIIQNYKTAFSVLQAVNKKYDFNPSNTYNCHVKYSGTSYEAGHYATPEKRFADPVTFSILSNNTEAYAINKDLTYKEKHYFSYMVLKSDSCYTSSYWNERTRTRKITDHGFVRFYIPYNLVVALNANKETLHHISTKGENHILGFNDSKGIKYYVEIDANTSLVNSVTILEYHGIHGDHYREIKYDDYQENEFGLFPKSIKDSENQFLKEELKLEAINLPYTAEDSIQINLTVSAIENDTSIAIVEIVPNVYLLKLYAYGNKLMVTEHEDFLSIYDAPGNIHVGNELIAFLTKRFNKPIKYCFISHHHPDHGGAVSAFNRIGATVITTQKNVAFYDKITAVSHTIGENVIAKKEIKANYVIVDSMSNKTFFKKSDLEVIAYEMGPLTGHTDEYLAFYFKKGRVLFLADLVDFPSNKVHDQKKRAYSVYELIKKEKIKVEKIVSGWPLKGQKNYGTMDDLILALKKNYPDIK
ncbi:MAG: hypothetical protein ACI8ZM_000341 [Crocinitomix sp.]|jgi:hypothetical protein